MTAKRLFVVLGNQLFCTRHLDEYRDAVIFMAEHVELCTDVRHHQQKIVLFLAAMRSHADALEEGGFRVHYRQLDAGSDSTYEDLLADAIDAIGCDEVVHFEIEDRPMEDRIRRFAEDRGLTQTVLDSPMFSCTRGQFADWLHGRRRPFMADFYKWQRRRLGVLIGDDSKPAGGRWSFDADNRKRLPRGIEIPPIRWPEKARHVDDVIAIVRDAFADHPGRAEDFAWPVTRRQALDWLDEFLDQRLSDFGPYEDAMTARSATVFHSALSPCLNLGLLTPDEVVEAALERIDAVPMQSLEGFVRHIIGWREFVRGIYREFGVEQASANFWSHERRLTDAWYSGNTGIPPLDDTIATAQRLGWAHHIPRLMVVANLMTLCEIRPDHAFRWFMEMFVDSSEWVMGPNVFGMGLFSDGGVFATKPYICGSNYLLKMSDYPKGQWCDAVDGLYWRFIDRHRDFFSGQPRLSMMVRSLDRMNDDRRLRIQDAAEAFLAEHTVTGPTDTF